MFQSGADNLVNGDSNRQYDVFIRDLTTSTTNLVSKSATGALANDGSGSPDVSADGRYVVFVSMATNLTSGYATSAQQIFLKDMTSGDVKLVSRSSSGDPSSVGSSYPRISCEGRIVTFQSNSNNLMTTDTTNPDEMVSRIYIVDMLQAINPVSITGDSSARVAYGALTCNGNYVGFTSDSSNVVSGDTNNLQDTFVYDRIHQSITRVSTDSYGNQATGGGAYTVRVSNDGKYAVFESDATNLVAGDTNGRFDVFMKDLQSGITQRISKNSSGIEGNAFSGIADISSDGRYVVYTSYATNLVPGFGMNGNVFAAQTGTENDY